MLAIFAAINSIMQEDLKLNNQFCFPIYSLAKELVALYRPILEGLDLTYPQYLVMILIWENEKMTGSQIGELLSLDKSTVTPILKRLEQKHLVEKKRCKRDERVVYISLTDEGKFMESKAVTVRQQLLEALPVSMDDLSELKTFANRVLSNIRKQQD